MKHQSSIRRVFKLRPLCLSLSILCAFPAQAADTVLDTVNVVAPREATLGLSTPSETGSRTGVTARELPASFESISGETIAERGDTRVIDAVTRSTGIVNVATPGGGGLSMSSRGFQGTGSVGIAEDGVRIQLASGSQNYPSTAWGYERAEVLRGPASIVYGTGTVGATLNMIRKQPSRESRQEVMVGVGSDGYKQLGLGGSGALGEYASYRVDVYGFHNDGYRDLGDSRGGKLMSRFRIQPRGDFYVDLTADYSEDNPQRYWGTPYDGNGRIVKSLRDENYNARDSVIRYKDTRLRAKANWRANDWLTVTDEVYYLESKRLWKNIERYTLNPAANTVARSDYLYIGHDLEQTGNRIEALVKASNHRIVAGWETQRINFRHTNNSPYGGSSTVSASNPAHGVWNSPDPALPKIDTTSTFNAFYVEDAWKFHDRWQVMAGIRRDMSEVSRDDLTGPGTNNYRNQKLNGTAWRLGLTHFLTPATSLYANFSRGHDPVTGLITANLAQSRYRLLKGKQIEAGIKQTFGGGLGEWTAALFRIDKKDILTRDPANSALTIQGGKQHSEGLELAAALSPAKNWRFEGNYAYIKARYDELLEPGSVGSVSREGNVPYNVPKHVANLWGHHFMGKWQVSLGTRYVAKRYADNANSHSMPSYMVADASVAWHYARNTTFRFFARNLTDKVYATARYNSQFILGDPRRFDLVAEFKF
ncbi:MAG: TonB-dependent receptor [Candidatus Accumulibacter sp.]|nr:TonB-dependent receptor [Accumulibacter sp.]